MIHSFLFKS